MSEAENSRETAGQAELIRLMTERLSLAEVRLLCFQLEIDYEELVGDNAGLTDLLIALLRHLQRRGRIADMLAILRQERPDVAWPQEMVERDGDASSTARPDQQPGAAFQISGNIQGGIVNVGGVQHFDQPIQIDMRKPRPSRSTDEEDDEAG